MGWMEEIIARRGGAVPFAEYMELALYEPSRGYYAHDVVRYGRDGDFLTAPTASPWYPRVVARVLERLAGVVGPVTIVDLAAGDGSFLEAALSSMTTGRQGVAGRVVAVERSPAMRDRIRSRLGSAGVHVAGSLLELPRGVGPVVLHASELYDALPVDRVVGAGRSLLELWVAVAEGRLTWESRPARAEVVEYFGGHGVTLAAGQVAEACRGASDLHRGHLEWAGDEGLALVLDYGYEAARLYNPRGRAGGSLVCYRGHVLSRDPLSRPGEQDLTAHVNWDDLRRPAAALGWHECGIWPLAELLIRGGLAELAEVHGVGMEADLDASTYAARQEIKRLLDPEGMGSDLKVLVQGCGRLVEAFSESTRLAE